MFSAACLAFACIIFAPQAGAVLTLVDLDYSKYEGTTLSNGITQWLGMRFAAPPLGSKRFMPPEDPPVNTEVQKADTHGKICLGTGDAPGKNTTSEDCLFLDVFAPTDATPSSALPVYVFIQGGGFNTNSNPNLNGTGLVAAGNHSLIVVTFNYRVGPYGFLVNGPHVTPNNGLRDQRKAFQWIQKHITSFGGDPTHVVLGGDSAGAASISLHLTANGGTNLNLFHAAAAESVSFATVFTVEQAQYQYDNLAIRLMCTGNATASLACLRSKSADELQAVNTNTPSPGAADPPLYMWDPVLDGDFVTDYTYAAFEKGAFIRVPTIIGDDTNGGTTFVPRDTSSLPQGNKFLKNQFPFLTLKMLAEINEFYPNQNNTCPNTGCFWRQTSDAYGQMRYMCPGLFISSAFTRAGVPASYAYRWNVEDPTQMVDGLGVPHTVELSALFGPENVPGKAPASYYPGQVNAPAVDVIQAYWTSFIRTFNPNTYRHEGSAIWEMWTDGTQGRLLFNTSGVTSMERIDGELRRKCDYFASIGVAIKQ